mmetsp:Transcript_71776/g.166009  ORF Transcript_71776/g.166009 Transcript_71776/m.166009 type:complete len:238 (-) Transcript_71776:3-716(-)
MQALLIPGANNAAQHSCSRQPTQETCRHSLERMFPAVGNPSSILLLALSRLLRQASPTVPASRPLEHRPPAAGPLRSCRLLEHLRLLLVPFVRLPSTAAWTAGSALKHFGWGLLQLTGSVSVAYLPTAPSPSDALPCPGHAGQLPYESCVGPGAVAAWPRWPQHSPACAWDLGPRRIVTLASDILHTHARRGDGLGSCTRGILHFGLFSRRQDSGRSRLFHRGHDWLLATAAAEHCC